MTARETPEAATTLEAPLTFAIIPAYNEANRAGYVVRAALRASLVDGVIFVDDGSTDETTANVLKAAEKEPNSDTLEVVRKQTNEKKTKAMISGVEKAREIGGTALKTIVFLDADSSPEWTRETPENRKLWQTAIHWLFRSKQEPLSQKVIDARYEVFVSTLAQSINEITEPVIDERETMRAGIYQRNALLDAILIARKKAGHAGNRAMSLETWDELMKHAERMGLGGWEIEGALESYIASLKKEDPDVQTGTFPMSGVVNVGSRVKTGSIWRGLVRMAAIHIQAIRGRVRYRSVR